MSKRKRVKPGRVSSGIVGADGKTVRKNILIGMGMYRTPEPETIHKVLGLISDFQERVPDVGIRFQTTCNTLLLGMRTGFAQTVLDDESIEYLLFIDDDMDFPVNQGFTPDGKEAAGFNPLVRLLQLNVDMVGAICIGRSKNGTPYIGTETDDGMMRFSYSKEQVMQPEPFQVDFIGFGMVLIHRRVFERIMPLVSYTPRGMFQSYNAWSQDENAIEKATEVLLEGLPVPEVMRRLDVIRSGCQSLGEDYSFCKLARQAGCEIWADPSFDVLHYGKYGYGRMDWYYRTTKEEERAKMAEETGRVVAEVG